MQRFKKALSNLWKDESAQGITEYILLLVIVVGIVLVFKKQIMSVISGKVNQLQQDIGSVSSSSNGP